MSDILKNADRLQTLTPGRNIFYRAVVENNNDGGKAGKVQVRIMGIHSENSKDGGDNKGHPTANLPWAEVMGTTAQHGGMSGIGISTVPLQGTWVWVFFDAGNFTKPVIVGIITGSSAKAADGGFGDPDGVYPLADRVGQGDVASLSTGNSGSTVISSVKNSNRDTGIPTGGPETWEEPEEQSSKAVYPNNVVYESVSGNIIEMDETGGNGRMHWFHNSGTYWEVVGGGHYTLKVIGNYFNLVDGNSARLNKGNETTTVQGSSLYKIDGTRKTVIGSDDEEIILGTLTQSVTGAVTETYSAGQITNGGPSITLKASVINLN